MKYARYIHLPAIVFLCYAPLFAVSMVWNFRIAQITGQPITEGPLKRNRSVIALLFDQYRKKYTGTTQNFMGGLGSCILNREPYFLRGDWAFSHIKEVKEHKTTFSGTETDDFLWTFGRGFELSDRSRMALSVLFGIPTHKILRLKHVDFGYGQVGLGMQWDGSYAYQYLHSRGAVLYGARYIHFFPGDSQDGLGCTYRFTIGTISDLLCAYKHNWTKHGFESGTTVRWRYGAAVKPCLADAVAKSNQGRTSLYAVYKYKFVLRDIENRLLFYIAYGRDYRPKAFGNRYIVTVWTSWNGRF